ncbi:Low temperature requirement protein LtrA [Micromonospora pallida]|uniref:Low temperature requirement protein LtrA n=1 Tax=Micromonospora pallida TaxID=145854 RepID=A0A1C6RRQ6_9ACTN|nr:low temperature requirement protein A [Micromonospora pallida]SCL19846.1 Low temperature requirement protein LtrA [Micromonospora pallida]
MTTTRPPPADRLEPAAHGPRRASFLELFFDLVFVFAFTRISARAFEDLALEPGGSAGWHPVTGGGKTLLLVLALWSIWQGTTLTIGRYDPYHLWLQTIVITSLVAAMVMGVAIPKAYTSYGLMFAGAYVVAQLSRPLILFLALRRYHLRQLKVRVLVVYAVVAVPWLVGALLPVMPRVILWTLALAIECVAARTGWPVPGLGRSRLDRWQPAGEHLAERYQQFFLIAVGETILFSGLAYSARSFTPARTTAFGLALLTSILLWRIYFHRAGRILAEAVAMATQPAAIARSAADTHLVMVTGVVAAAIGYELAIEHPLDHPEASWIALILGGPLLFLAGRARFEYEVFGRVSPSRWIAMAALVAPVWVLLHHPLLYSAGTAAVVLLAVAVADARRAHHRPPEPAAPPF